MVASARQRTGSQAAVITWMRLARVYGVIDRMSAEKMRANGLTMAQFDVLAQVGAAEGQSQQALANKLLVTKGNVTQLLDRMEGQGLVERRSAPSGRGNLLFLTPAGWELRDRLLPAHEAMIADQMAGLDEQELSQLSRLLRSIERAIDARSSAATQGSR